MSLLSDFEFAQHPFMWAAVAETLAQSAHPIFYGAVEQRERYEAATGLAWEKAERLYAYADEPRQPVTVDVDCDEPAFLPAFLLYGYAIENLLKGLFVSKNLHAIHDQRLQVPAVHDLPQLAKEAGFVPTTTEATLLELLGTVTVWLGRYPVARTRQQHGAVGLNREGIFDNPVEAGLASQDLIRKLQGLLDDGKPRSKGGCVIAGL